MTSIPAPSSSTLPSGVVGRAPGSRSVLMTTSSWGSLGPVFLAWNVTWPAGADAGAGVRENSCRVTATVVAAVVVGAWVAGAPAGSSSSPQATRARPATTTVSRTVHPRMGNRPRASIDAPLADADNLRNTLATRRRRPEADGRPGDSSIWLTLGRAFGAEKEHDGTVIASEGRGAAQQARRHLP